MAMMPPTACTEQPCPYPAVDRGRCRIHRQSTTERGYGADHQAEARSARNGARCEGCGCSSNLQRDHRIPKSLGGSQDPSNKRWLCACPEHGCHARLGVRRDRPAVFA